MKRLALVGFMGSGKTTIGRLLGKTLSLPFVDLDEEIVRSTGQTITQIFATEGESGFRVYEYQVLCQHARQETGSVLSTGGGLVTEKAARAILMQNYYIIYLDVPFELALGRIRKDGDTRPLAGDSPDAYAQIKERFQVRKPIYESVANFRCEITEGSPERIVGKIISHLESEK